MEEHYQNFLLSRKCLIVVVLHKETNLEFKGFSRCKYDHKKYVKFPTSASGLLLVADEDFE